jgi:ribosomal protein S27AE
MTAPRALRHSRACPQCSGRMFLEPDDSSHQLYGSRAVCIACGHDEWEHESFAERTPPEQWRTPGRGF